jgi:PhzF family phenazine biosynthesis protein
MSVPIFTVDAFTDEPFAGNPAGVCLLEDPQEPAWMQNVAREMNLSETAFLSPSAGDGFELRWFTPKVEIDLCGHATLATAHVLWESGTLDRRSVARFHTRSGVLTAEQRGDWIELDFPAKAVTEAAPPKGLVEALGVKPRFVGRNEFDYLVEVASPEHVRKVRPDFVQLTGVEARGVIVTSRADEPGVDFVSRFFAPRAGVPEDPVTGSAHCALAPYWAQLLEKTEMVGHQLSARGGSVRVRIEGDRVVLGGRAVTILRGVLV